MPKKNPIKQSMEPQERYERVFDLVHRRSSWVTREIFDACYSPDIYQGSDKDVAAEIEQLCIEYTSAPIPAPVDNPPDPAGE